MQKWFRKLLFYPALFDGIDPVRSAQLLTFVFRLTILVAMVGLGVNLLIEPKLVRSLPNLIVVLVIVLLQKLLIRKLIKLAGVLYLCLIFFTVLYLVVFSGGITSPVFAILIVVSFFAGILLGGKGSVTFVMMTLFAGGILVGLDYVDWLEVRIVYYPVDFIVVYGVVLVSIMGLSFFVMKNLREALEQAHREINERHLATASFQKLERRYKAIFDHTNDAVILMDFDSTILDINQRGAEMFGYERGDMIGKRGLNFVSNEARDEGQTSLMNVIQGQNLPIYERKMLYKDGSEFLVEVNLSLVFDENGVPIQTQSVLRDITERKKTETNLRDIEHRYRTLFEGSNDGIFILGLDGLIEEVNPQAASLLGYKPSEIIGSHASLFVVPDQQDQVSFQINTLLDSGHVPIYERLVRRRDGTLITFEINAGIVYDIDGKPQSIQSIVRDITGRKQAEEELRTLIRQLERQRAKIQTSLEVSKAAISILDPQTLIQQSVELIKTRFEYYYVGLFLVDETHQFAVLRGGTGEAGKTMLVSRHKLPIGHGSMVGWCIENKQPRIAMDVGLDALHFHNPLLPDTQSELALPLIARGEVIGALTFQSDFHSAFPSEDITVLQVMTDLIAIAINNAHLHTEVTAYTGELEERVRERTAQLQNTNRELEAFSYSVSHDLRTPLRAINGYSSILLEDFTDEFSPLARSFQEKIRNNAVRMGELVDGLLAFSRLGRKKIQKSEVKPQILVKEILDELEPEIAEREIEFVVEELPPFEADPLLLKQVYANLIGNAIKFTRVNLKPHITIGSQYTERGLAYFVKDNGTGFDMQYINRLFGVFQRLHRDEEFEGTGVGLAIVHRIIARHGGEVWAEAEIGKGATFFFTLGGMAIDESGIFF